MITNVLARAAATIGLFIGAMAPSAASSIVTFDIPGSTATYPYAINAGGVTTGYYTDRSSIAHGFVRDGSGVISECSLSGATATVADSINDAGTIGGRDTDGNGFVHGFNLTP